jgi:glycosyltransferase involved in cell wall biosynthesis
LKILHISPYAELGGCEFNALTIIEEIDAQHDVLLLNDGNGPFVDIWKKNGAQIASINLLDKPFFTWKKALVHQLKGKRYDIIIFWSHMHMPVVLSALTQFSNRILVHIGNPVIFGFKQKLLRSIQNAMYAYDRASVELRPVSQYVLQSSTTTPAYKVLKSKVSFKPIVVEDFETQRDIEKGNVIGMMARMDTIKDFTTLILAFAKLCETHPHLELHLAGDGAERDNLEKLCFRLGIKNRVQFLGKVNDKKMFYQSIDIFVFSTSSKEGLAGVVGEALVCGLPTICSDLPMLREWDPDNVVIQWFEARNFDQLSERLEFSLANFKTCKAQSLKQIPYFKNKFAPHTFAQNYIDA